MPHAKKTTRPASDVRVRAAALRTKAAAASADPIFAVIQAGRELFSPARAEYHEGGGRAAQPSIEALFAHLRGPLLATKPTTAAGAIALARYAVDFRRLTGSSLDDEALTIIAHIAAVRAA